MKYVHSLPSKSLKNKQTNKNQYKRRKERNKERKKSQNSEALQKHMPKMLAGVVYKNSNLENILLHKNGPIYTG